VCLGCRRNIISLLCDLMDTVSSLFWHSYLNIACYVPIVYFSFCFVTLADENDMAKALSLSGSSLKGSELSIDVSKRAQRKSEGYNSRGGFTSPRGGGSQRGDYCIQLTPYLLNLCALDW